MRFYKTIILSLAIVITPVTQTVFAAAARSVGVIRESSGKVTVLRNGITASAKIEQKINQGDIIKTGADGHAVLQHESGFVSTVGPNATLRVSAVLLNLSGLTLARGVVHTKGHLREKNNIFRIVTPVAVTGVRGTEFVVAGADDGVSIVVVNQGVVTTGIGQEVSSVYAGSKTEGKVSAGYALPRTGRLTSEQAESWRTEQEKDMAFRVKQILAELTQLQIKEEADWQAIEEEVLKTSRRIMAGIATPADKLFFHRVFDIEDRMSARRLLAIDLREWAGITSTTEASSERIRLQKVWDARDWRRSIWKTLEEGGIPTHPGTENQRRAMEDAQEHIRKTPQTIRAHIPVKPGSGSLFPNVVRGVCFGMTPDELLVIRPNITTHSTAYIGNIPVVYQEKKLSGGDYSTPGWFTGMYTFYGGKLIQGTFYAFTGSEKIRKSLLEKFIKLFGSPWRYRVEKDWVQQGVIKGSTVEFKGNDVEVIVVSRWVPSLQGKIRGLELRVRLPGFDTILEKPGQFSIPVSDFAAQQKKDFPELEDIRK